MRLPKNFRESGPTQKYLHCWCFSSSADGAWDGGNEIVEGGMVVGVVVDGIELGSKFVGLVDGVALGTRKRGNSIES